MKHSATRALALLEAMNLRPVSAVGDLARTTGISKPSVVRLLAILMEDGYVQRASKAGSYVLAPKVKLLSAGFRDDTVVARAAGPHMEALTERLKWPTALGMFEQGGMVVRYSTIPSSPLSWYRTTLYLRLELLHSAMGLAFLAFSSPSLRETLLAAEASEGASADEIAEARFEAIRTRGYATRPPNAEHPTRSISVPLVLEDRVLAALSVTIFGKTMTTDEAVRRYLEPLKGAAEDIVRDSGLN